MTAAPVPHPTCIEVTGIDQTPRSQWACGPQCPKEAAAMIDSNIEQARRGGE